MKTEAEIKQALQIIIDNREAKALNYAVNYAIAGLQNDRQSVEDSSSLRS